jgi:ABC-type iron transport system FetAB permease component
VRLKRDGGDRRAQIAAALTPGASPRQCTASVIRRSVRLAMAPVLGSTKTMGIVSLLPPAACSPCSSSFGG